MKNEINNEINKKVKSLNESNSSSKVEKRKNKESSVKIAADSKKNIFSLLENLQIESLFPLSENIESKLFKLVAEVLRLRGRF